MISRRLAVVCSCALTYGLVSTTWLVADDGAISAAVADASPTSGPVLKLDFEPTAPPSPTPTELVNGARLAAVGPTAELFTGMPSSNQALQLDGQGAHVRIADAEEASTLRFSDGDAMTLEAWVKLDKLASGANVYVVGKGRTYERERIENQNYALRLTGNAGEARPSFLFATRPEPDSQPVYHRWTGDRGFAVDGGWHHVAISYRFGAPDSIAAVVDGEKVKGKWDMGGATRQAPIVDGDAVWVGSSRGGDPGNSLAGAVDDVIIHREIVPLATLTARRRPIARPPEFPTAHDDRRVTITLHSGIASHSVWPATAPPVEFHFSTPAMALHRLPMRYISGGIRQPWRAPLLLRAHCRTELPGGELTFLVRSPGLARLWVDGQVVLSTPPHIITPSAHQPFEVYQADHPWLHVPRAGDVEKRVTIRLDAGRHEIVLEQIVGAKNLRCETGDTTVAVRRGDELFTLLGPVLFELPLTDAGWQAYRDALENELAAMDRQSRRETTAQESDFWQRRHAMARDVIAAKPALAIPPATVGLVEAACCLAEHSTGANPSGTTPAAVLESARDVDRFINASVLKASGDSIESTLAQRLNATATDAVFIRRLYLDTVGVVPSAEQVSRFLRDQRPDKRSRLIDQLLADERWADHWTSYWQDVLAENPSILKPTLNNTGPFRWWIHDALVENKPMDRFVTELIRMEGDKLGGGAAGFAMASENDVPMAAKAHIITGAFLGVEMKCARCHDAPFHPWRQKELFGLAAMLDNKPIKVPATSSVPKEFFDRKKNDSPINLSIFPGDTIEPSWPLSDLNPEVPSPEWLGRESASREQLAAYITSPHNERFAQVMVNRLWQRTMGWGLMTHLSDWHGQDPRQGELLHYLARVFVRDGYDYKQLARIIFNSQAYQRTAVDGASAPAALAYASPWIRRLTAEQVVDSLHSLAGLPMGTEEITFDPAGQQAHDAFLNLGLPRRAWQLTSLSNERDRPSLALPNAAIVVECLEAFGWRGSRQEPVSHRETDANMVQPGVIANSAFSVRLSRLSDDSFFTQLAIDARSPQEFVVLAFQQVLSRPPEVDELKAFVQQIEAGWDSRIVSLSVPQSEPKAHRGFVTWANHFDIRANQLMRELEREVAAGPQPTGRLKAEWRERAEDVVWALMNTPEFQFVP